MTSHFDLMTTYYQSVA